MGRSNGSESEGGEMVLGRKGRDKAERGGGKSRGMHGMLMYSR